MILNVRLKDILNIEKWQRVQDAVAEETGMAMVTCDYKGKPICLPSNRSPFCKAVCEIPEALKICERCNSVGGYEAFRNGAPFFFKCHMGLFNVAVPLIADDNYLGYVIMGGVRAGENEEEFFEETCRASDIKDYLPEEGERLRAEIPGMIFEEMKKKSSFVGTLTDCLISGKYEIIRERLSGTQRPLEQLSVREEEPEPDSKYVVNMLFPAFDYIAIHFRESISLQFIADLCHVSPSYFSRMFAKETRESFSTYIMKLRISYAKQQISTTEKSIAEIAFDSGFGDSSHFIKSFKKIEGITPLQYRKKML